MPLQVPLDSCACAGYYPFFSHSIPHMLFLVVPPGFLGSPGLEMEQA
jgi:hypothetical protein